LNLLQLSQIFFGFVCSLTFPYFFFSRRDWGTTVMQLWASNFNVLQPSLISIGTLLNVGIIYSADVEDRLPQLAQQMGRTVNEVA
jgi:hypothetical protein